MSDRHEQRRWWTWPLVCLLLGLAVVSLVLWGRPLLALLSDRQRIDTFVTGLGPWGPAGIALLEMAQVLLAPVPGTAIELASGFLYGPWLGALYAMAGLVVGSLVAFLLARRFGRPLLLRFLSRRALDRLDALMERGGSLLFFLLWLLPFVPDDLVCLAAGLIAMPTHRFLLLMAVGRLPGILFSTSLGARIAGVDPAWAGVLLVVMALAALLLWRFGEPLQRALLDLAGRLHDRFRR